VLDVLCVGFSCVDLLFPFVGLPRYDRKNEFAELVQEGGGPAATAAVALRRLGCSVGLISLVGDDSWGLFVARRLADEGIPTDLLLVQPGARTPLSIILADPDGGARTILWNRGTLSPISAPQVRDRWRTARIVLVDEIYPEASTEALRLAHHSQVPVVFDAGTARSGLDTLVQHADFLVTSEHFPQRFSGIPVAEDALRALQLLNGRPVISTRGAKGCWLDDGQRLQVFPPVQVTARDSTGAGDAFHAAFAFAALQKWDVRRACSFANYYASQSCLQLGGRAGLLRADQIGPWLREELGS
jgi:sulfofructose kinase